jgi:hypothetical protein
MNRREFIAGLGQDRQGDEATRRRRGRSDTVVVGIVLYGAMGTSGEGVRRARSRLNRRRRGPRSAFGRRYFSTAASP